MERGGGRVEWKGNAFLGDHSVLSVMKFITWLYFSQQFFAEIVGDRNLVN